jgi:DNA repair protein RadC
LIFKEVVDMRKMTIKSWAVEDRPREKFAARGRDYLSDAELLAIIMGSGNAEDSAVDLARKILADHDNNLNNLAKMSVDALKKYRGVGEAKAIAISAALELGRRRRDVLFEDQPKILTSRAAFNLAHHVFIDRAFEIFVVILLDRANRMMHMQELSRGGTNKTIVDVPMIFKLAIEKNASSIICMHNHPSGSLKPSEPDIKITRSIKDAGELLSIKLLDHIIVTNAGYFSFADDSLI